MSGQRERELDYDWDRLDFLRKKLNSAHPVAVADLRVFMDFLRALALRGQFFRTPTSDYSSNRK